MQTMLNGNGTNGFLKRIGMMIAIGVTIFGAGTGWGLYASTLSIVSKTSEQLDTRVTDVEKVVIRFDEKICYIIEKLDKIERKLDE